MPRFVILEHRTPPNYARPLHWDLMLQAGESLWTWALESPPAAGEEIAAWALADHRPHYIDYEGPLPDGRGSVTRWEAGIYETQRQEDGRLDVLLRGPRLGECGLRLLRCEPPVIEGDAQRWRARFTGFDGEW